MSDQNLPITSTSPEDDTGELPPLLVPGDILAGRYRIQTVLQGPEGPVYRAEDLWRCPECGVTASSPNEGYCRACGTALDRRPLCTIRLVTTAPPRTIKTGTELFDLHGLVFLMVPDDAQRADNLPARGLRLRVGAGSDPGRVRQTDEDSVLAVSVAAFHLGRAETCLGLFAVADGIGGLAAGATASRLVLQHLARHFAGRVLLTELDRHERSGEHLLAELAEAVQAANDDLYSHQPAQGAVNAMGTTLTVAYVRGRQAAIANVGDSRTYRWRAGHLEQLTVDHSMVASLVRAGLAQPEDIYTHPQKSLITRSLGDQAAVEVDTFLCDITPGDRLVLCCDGIWEMLRDDELAAILRAEPDPQRAVNMLITRANANGGEDNLSAVIVAVEEAGT